MSDETKPTGLPPVHPDMIEGDNTGRFRLIAREEVKSEVNGFFSTAEKFYKRARLLITILVSVAGGVIALDHWLGSLAKRAELDELNGKVSIMGGKIDTLTTALDMLREELKKNRKP